MKKIYFSFIFLAILFFGVSAGAHQPRLVGDEADITVENPEISQAFYGTLVGYPIKYHISSSVPFRLYVSLLAPDIEGIDKDISAAISRSGDGGPYSDLVFLDGTQHEWTQFYEEFAGDNYWQGPEKTMEAEAGEYTVMVFSQDNIGKYVFVVGQKESFPFSEMIHTIKVLPTLKTDFFGKPWYLGYYNITGIFLVGFVFLVGIFLLGGGLGIRYILKKRRDKATKEVIKTPQAQ